MAEPGKTILTTVVRDYVSPWEASQLAGSYWDVVGTAIGIPRFVERTCFGLSPAQIGQQAHSHFRSPLHLRMAIEGLAAWDRETLRQCTDAWPRPEQVAADNWWWLAAWESAMRHLKAVNAVTLDDFLVSPSETLMLQAMELWEDPDLPRVEKPGTSSPQAAARALLPALTGQRLKDPVPPDPAAILRRLRGHESLLDEAACSGIAAQIEAWTDDPEKPNINLPILLDIGRIVCPEAVDDARVSLAERLPFFSNLTDWCEECLILLTDWHLP